MSASVSSTALAGFAGHVLAEARSAALGGGGQSIVFDEVKWRRLTRAPAGRRGPARAIGSGASTCSPASTRCQFVEVVAGTS